MNERSALRRETKFAVVSVLVCSIFARSANRVLVALSISPIRSSFGAVRYSVAFCSFETELDDAIESAEQAGIRDAEAQMHQVGASASVRLGTRRFALLAELTVMRLFFEPEILGAPTDLGGWLIEPGVGLSAQF